MAHITVWRSYNVNRVRQGMLRYIRDFYNEHGFTPTVREIMRAKGISSTSVVFYHLGQLERAGEISRNGLAYQHRNIVLASKYRRVAVPIIGTLNNGSFEPAP